MPERVLFHIKNPPLGAVYRKLLLYTFALFFVVGNFFRFIPLQAFPSNFSLLEGILYALALPLYFSRFRKSFLFIVVVFTSTLYGSLLYGFDGTSVLYSFKLLGMVAAGSVVGEALHREGGLPFLIKIFVFTLAIGALIFLFFPRAHTFFQLLEGMGIRFLGDPHERRFISTFFDPNYYCAIAIIPLILTWQMRHQKPYFALSLLFFLSILLTFSRSGIAAALLVILAGASLQIKKTHFKLLRFLPLLLFLGLPFLFSQEFAYFTSRLVHFLDDPSAQNRFATFQFGISTFLEHPLFGIGYNYLPHFLKEESHLMGIDSSFLTTLLTFGLIPTLAFATYGVIWTVKKWRRFTPLFKWLYFYLLISILFTSQFNNLLYYQFWLIPVIALFVYENRHCS